MGTQYKVLSGAAFPCVEGNGEWFHLCPALTSCDVFLVGDVIVQECSPPYTEGPVPLPGEGALHWAHGGKRGGNNPSCSEETLHR